MLRVGTTCRSQIDDVPQISWSTLSEIKKEKKERAREDEDLRLAAPREREKKVPFSDKIVVAMPEFDLCGCFEFCQAQSRLTCRALATSFRRVMRADNVAEAP